jgi:hypothetical protein
VGWARQGSKRTTGLRCGQGPSRHLTDVFAKLGIPGRSELVDLFAHAAPTVRQP